jgi:SAP domain/U-box domain
MEPLDDVFIKSLTRDQLREECKRVNLLTTGEKADLQQRLLNHHQAVTRDIENGTLTRIENGKTDDTKENNDPKPPPAPKECPSADLICPITLQLPWDPVTADDGRVYEQAAIEQHIAFQQSNLKSPMTNTPMGGRLFPAPQHKNVIEVLIGIVIDVFIVIGVLIGDLVSKWPLIGDLVSKWNEKVKEKDLTEDWLKKAAKGDAEAMYKVGLCFLNGEYGFIKDEQLGYYLQCKAHDAGHASGTAMVGLCLYRGLGVAKCDRQALMHIGIAAGKGSRCAAWILGKNFAFGGGGLRLKSNKKEAIRWLRVAVEGGYTVCDDLAQEGFEKAQKLLAELTADATA